MRVCRIRSMPSNEGRVRAHSRTVHSGFRAQWAQRAQILKQKGLTTRFVGPKARRPRKRAHVSGPARPGVHNPGCSTADAEVAIRTPGPRAVAFVGRGFSAPGVSHENVARFLAGPLARESPTVARATSVSALVRLYLWLRWLTALRQKGAKLFVQFVIPLRALCSR